jgi:hypothetical protein
MDRQLCEKRQSAMSRCKIYICSIEGPTRCTCIYVYVFFIPLYFLDLHVSGAICTHPQEHKLQRTAIGVCNGFGMLKFFIVMHAQFCDCYFCSVLCILCTVCM